MVEFVGERKSRFGRIVLIVFGLLLLLAIAWTAFSLSWAYSEGERAGVLQKFSKKGWLCKTYEGELAQYVVGGVAPQQWASRSACTTPSIAVCPRAVSGIRPILRAASKASTAPSLQALHR
jgi:hypothetical protein